MELSVPRRTERLVLRPLDDDDIEDVLAYRARAEVCRYLQHEPMDRDEVESFVHEWESATTVAADGDEIVLGVEFEHRVVGDVRLHVGRIVDGQGEIGWAFHPRVRGRGLATEAACSIIDAAFDELALHRVWAQLDPRNVASAALCERLGMRREALLREESWFKGAWGDLAIYGLLRDEWDSRHEVWT